MISRSLARLVLVLCGFLARAACLFAGDFQITALDSSGSLAWSNAYPAGVLTVEVARSVRGPWSPDQNYFTSNRVGSARWAPSETSFARLLSVDISTNSPAHFTNLVNSYGILETIAGKYIVGGSGDKVNYWLPEYEGGPATNAVLSRAHNAFPNPITDDVLIVDEGSSSILRVATDGTIHTFAGTHTNGFNGDGPAPATTLRLYYPNGGWMSPNGTFYILDTYNGKVRRVDTNGIATTLFTTAPMGDGRALWVKSDESVIYFGSGNGTASTLNKWTPATGVTVVRSDFGDLGNIKGDEQTGDLYVTDRDAYRIYRMSPDGKLVTIAGNGTATGGGDGFPVLQTGLNKPRAICFLPNTGGYFVGEHEGNHIWYVDPASIVHLWVNGNSTGTTPRGDGRWFYDSPSTPKMTKIRAINMDRHGNLIIMENNYAYVRRIRFQRMVP